MELKCQRVFSYLYKVNVSFKKPEIENLSPLLDSKYTKITVRTMHKLPYNPYQAQVNPGPAIHQNADHPSVKHHFVKISYICALPSVANFKTARLTECNWNGLKYRTHINSDGISWPRTCKPGRFPRNFVNVISGSQLNLLMANSEHEH